MEVLSEVRGSSVCYYIISHFGEIVNAFSYKSEKIYNMEYKNIFKNNLKELRLEKDVGQVELAKAIGVSKGVISLWENGLREPSMYSLIALAKYFNVTIDELVGLN